jgi:polar amino acid transport system ATP-binding protein
VNRSLNHHVPADPDLRAMIEIADLWKSFGRVEVLKGISLRVERGAVVAVIGPSGSGKSTLLRCINLLEDPERGRIRVGEREMQFGAGRRRGPSDRDLAAFRATTGMVFQHFNLFPHMTALKNCIEAPCTVLKMPKAEAEARAKDLLEMVGLGNKLNHYPGQLSGGQQQRVAIARALALRPKVMLFDEVTSALDPELVGEVLNVIRRLGAEFDLTMLMVTHQMGFAKEFADRVCFFYGGRICEQGPPDKIFGAPENDRTRQFLKAVLEAT